MNDMIQLEIQNPNIEKTILQGETYLVSLLMYEYFMVKVETDDGFYQFETNLPEWLIHLTKFLNSQKDSYVGDMIYSGGKFIASRTSDKDRVLIYNLKNQKDQWMQLADGDMKDLHYLVKEKLLNFLKTTYGSELQYLDATEIDLELR